MRSAPSVVITDMIVRGFYGPLFTGLDVIEIGLGERMKDLRVVERIYREFLELGVDRSTTVWGVGGGIVCDLTGFIASTFMRGLKFGFIPTTLLAQVDAGIGGKNGINLDGYKNIAGVFRQPRSIVLSFDFLRTLSDSDILCGIAEIVKYGLIKSASLFKFLERNWSALCSLEPRVLKKTVVESIRIKTDIVRKDAEECHERKQLNFGHTLGHAIEKLSQVPHGEAVALGMSFAVRLSAAKGFLSEPDARQAESLLEKLKRPVPATLSPELLVRAIHKDKKRRGSRLDFIMLEKIGKARIVEMSFSELEKSIHDLCQHC